MVRDDYYENIFWKLVNSYEEYKAWLLEMWDKKSHYHDAGIYSCEWEQNLFDNKETVFFDAVGAYIDEWCEEYPDVHDIDKTYIIRHKPESYPAVCIYEYDMKQILFMEVVKLLKDGNDNG